MIEEKLLRLERMSRAEKIKHWVDEKPWELEGVTLRLPFAGRPFGPGVVHMDDRGNIIKSPFLVNRPCFGQVGAFLRHGGNRHVFSPRNGGYHPDRCARCPVMEACHFVCEKRLNCTPQIQALYLEWKHRGGRASSWPKNGSPGSARVTLRYLLDALKQQEFTSDNDQRVQDHYKGRIERKRQDECERKRQDRVKQLVAAARQGDLAPEVVEVLKQECLVRSNRYEEVWHLPTAPRPLRKSKGNSRIFDALVWLAWKRIEMRGKHPNPSSCASELQALGREHGRTHNALRDKVQRSIKRMVILESMPMPGDPDGDAVWPPFTVKDLRKAVEEYTLQANRIGEAASVQLRPLQNGQVQAIAASNA